MKLGSWGSYCTLLRTLYLLFRDASKSGVKVDVSSKTDPNQPPPLNGTAMETVLGTEYPDENIQIEPPHKTPLIR